MKVELLQAVEYVHPHEAGSVLDVTAKVAWRWIDAGIAREWSPPPPPAKPEVSVEVEPEVDDEIVFDEE